MKRVASLYLPDLAIDRLRRIVEGGTVLRDVERHGTVALRHPLEHGGERRREDLPAGLGDCVLRLPDAGRPDGERERIVLRDVARVVVDADEVDRLPDQLHVLVGELGPCLAEDLAHLLGVVRQAALLDELLRPVADVRTEVPVLVAHQPFDLTGGPRDDARVAAERGGDLLRLRNAVRHAAGAQHLERVDRHDLAAQHHPGGLAQRGQVGQRVARQDHEVGGRALLEQQPLGLFQHREQFLLETRHLSHRKDRGEAPVFIG